MMESTSITNINSFRHVKLVPDCTFSLLPGSLLIQVAKKPIVFDRQRISVQMVHTPLKLS